MKKGKGEGDKGKGKENTSLVTAILKTSESRENAAYLKTLVFFLFFWGLEDFKKKKSVC